MSKFLMSAVLALGLTAGFAGMGQPLFATSPPPPNRAPDISSCCYSTRADAVIEGEGELDQGNYYAYSIVELDANHWQLNLWGNR